MKRITRFEEGGTYVYSVLLKAKNGYVFSDSCPVMVNNRAVIAAHVQKTADGLLVTEVKMLTPKKTPRKRRSRLSRSAARPSALPTGNMIRPLPLLPT